MSVMMMAPADANKPPVISSEERHDVANLHFATIRR